MSKKIFHGSCHCGKIKFQANLDLTKGSGKCNCTFCRKNSYWSIKTSLEDFKLLQGQDSITEYSNNRDFGYYVFCKHCGTMPYGISTKTEWTQEGPSIKISSLDDMSTEEMNSLSIQYYHGIDDTWHTITDPEIIKTMY
jgi:hypothetical protein